MRNCLAIALLWSMMLPAASGAALAETLLWTDRPVRIDRDRQQLERLPASTAAAAAPASVRVEVGRDLKVIDAANFRTRGIDYRIGGIAGLKPNEICRDERGRRWACGVRSRAMLRSLLQRRYLAARCTVTKGDVSPVEVACRYSDEDLGDYLVSRGLAVPAPSAPPEP